MEDWIDIQIAKLMIWRLKKGYGANCETKDTDDLPELKENTKARCASCQAKETIEFLERHIKLCQF